MNAVRPLSEGERVGEYQILARVGAGGMGVVYRALDLKLQRTVALKFLPEDLVQNPDQKEHFLREARTASALDHPNIGVIHGIEQTGDGRTFIVMAYYDGETLARKLLGGPLSVEQATDIAIQMARGLSEAHAHAIVHRDIKPSNVIITHHNVAKIVDFGLARAVSNISTTRSLGTSGTIGYMSPEQSLGKLVDQRSDIWALGTVMAEMCTGRNPFERESAPATIVAILNEPPQLPEQLPIELRGIIYRTLSKDAATRYSSCSEILTDLEGFRSQLTPGVQTRRSSRASSALKDSIGHASLRMLEGGGRKAKTAWWIAGIAAAAVLVVAGVIPGVRNRLFGHREEHIAVLPFENVGQNSANEAVSEGLVDSLTSRLSNLDSGGQSLWIVPASEVRRQKVMDPVAARRDLGATLAVKGSILRDGKDIRLTVNLIDTKTLRQIGSVALEDRAGDLASLQDEAVARVAQLMHIKVTAAMLRDAGGSVAPAAYEDYLNALGYMQRYDKPGNLDLALNALNNAVKTDPQFALGFAALGQAYQLKYVVDQNPKWMDEAAANCQHALELDSRLPAAYVTLGRMHEDTGKYDLAAQEFQKALDLNPRDADALNGIGGTYEKAGRLKDAEAAFQKAIALRNDDWAEYNALGLFYDRQGKYSQSVAQFQRAAELTPDNAQVYSNLAAVYIDTSDAKVIPKAEEALKKSIELSPSYAAYANLGMLYSQEKRYPDSAAATEKALSLNDKNYRVWENLAIAYEQLNQQEKASAAREHELGLVEADAKIQPKDAELQSFLGLLYAQKKMAEQADSHLQTALALSGEDQAVLENVAEAYEDLGRRKQAMEYIQKALAKGYPMESIKMNPAWAKLLADPNFRPK
ncbi:MAG TPA: protein kinase [Candidatus Sulfotelmatobacter sp.]|nr:protein kinase [Candidatus Sulfotelmatobacter sp.]